MARSEKRTLSIEARLKNYIKGDLTILERNVGRFALNAVRSFQTLKGALFNVKTAIGGIGVAFGAIKFAQFARDTAQQADDLQDLANATGDLVANLSELQAAFQLNGIEAEAFEGVVLAVAKAQRQALDGNTKVADGFAELGVTLEELRNLAPSALFEQMSEGLEVYNSEQDKAVALGKVVPKQFLELLPAIGQGVQEFRENILEVRDLGATLTDEQAASAAAVSDALDKLNLAVQAVGRSFLAAFGPEVAGGLEQIAKLIVANRDAIADFAKVIAEVVVGAVNILIDVFIELVDVIEEIPGIDLVDPKQTAELERQVALLTQTQNILRAQQSYRASEEFNRGKQDAIDRAQLQIDELNQQIEGLEASTRLRELRKNLQQQAGNAAAQVRAQFDAAARQQTGAAPAAAAAAPERVGIPSLGLPSLDAVTEYARKLGTQVGSVFRATRGQTTPVAAPEDALARDRETLAIQQQVAALREDQRAIADLKTEADKLDLRALFIDGKVSAQEYESTLDRINQRQQRLKNLVTGGDFWGGFSAGARESIQQLTDLTAAGREAGAQLVDAFGSGLTDAFTDIIMGTKSAGEAFKGLAVLMLQEIARIAAKMLSLRIISSIFGGPAATPAMENGGILPGNVTGTAPVRAFARGGIARRPTMALFGEGRTAEAFVPLPDNRSIPVSFVGGGAQTGTNVSINITAMDSRDVQRALLEQQGTLRNIFTNGIETRSSMRGAVRRAVS